MSGNFAAQSPFRSCEMSCETHLWHTSAISQPMPPSSQLRTTLQNHLQAANEVANHLQVAESPLSCEITNSTNQTLRIFSEDEWIGSLSLGVKKAGCACHIEYEIAEEAMNFMSYVAEVSRGWDEPNARDMGRMKSLPDAKGEMYILNDGIDMKAKIAAMARRLEELEMKKMQEVQAISQTPLQAMPCAICLSYEHLVEECPTIPTTREMFGFWMIKIRRNCKEIEGRSLGVKRSSRAREKPWSARFRSLKRAPAKITLGCEIISQPPSTRCRCEISYRLGNDFAAPCPPLRKFSQL
uniref:Retrotransposon gag domain-containing protein n=1 Tax=Vitis vinifera TaxID=29760 RepID=A5BCQ2_VITVI|nr:hypothetical protein VITISV_013177 [Vitis vinifera]